MSDSRAKIACLGWGALIWDPRELPIVGGRAAWNNDGPWLPIEFARQSKGDRLTLVLMQEGKLVQTLWAKMRCDDLEMAKNSLAEREGCAKVGAWPGGGDLDPHSAIIEQWAISKGLDGVVWTNLPAKFASTSGRVPTADEALGYLRRLIETEGAARAEEYVRNAPAQVKTPYRVVFERELGWTTCLQQRF